MKVKIFDESHEQDLEEAVNRFLSDPTIKKIIDIKYQVAVMFALNEQIYCYSALIMYND